MKTEFVDYVLHSPKFDKIYVGYTSDLIDRYYSHNLLATKGFTVSFRPWRVVYVEFFELKTDAMKREKALKSSRGRDFIRTKVIPELDGLDLQLTFPRYIERSSVNVWQNVFVLTQHYFR